MQEIAPHLPELVPYLFNNLNDPKVAKQMSILLVNSLNVLSGLATRSIDHMLDSWTLRILDCAKRAAEPGCKETFLGTSCATLASAYFG